MACPSWKLLLAAAAVCAVKMPTHLRLDQLLRQVPANYAFVESAETAWPRRAARKRPLKLLFLKATTWSRRALRCGGTWWWLRELNVKIFLDRQSLPHADRQRGLPPTTCPSAMATALNKLRSCRIKVTKATAAQISICRRARRVEGMEDFARKVRTVVRFSCAGFIPDDRSLGVSLCACTHQVMSHEDPAPQHAMLYVYTRSSDVAYR